MYTSIHNPVGILEDVAFELSFQKPVYQSRTSMNSSGATCRHRGASRQPLVLQLQTLNSGFTDSANSGITDPVSVGAASDGTVQLQSGTSLNSANSEACCFIHSLAHPNLLNDAATAEAAHWQLHHKNQRRH